MRRRQAASCVLLVTRGRALHESRAARRRAPAATHRSVAPPLLVACGCSSSGRPRGGRRCSPALLHRPARRDPRGLDGCGSERGESGPACPHDGCAHLALCAEGASPLRTRAKARRPLSRCIPGADSRELGCALAPSAPNGVKNHKTKRGPLPKAAPLAQGGNHFRESAAADQPAFPFVSAFQRD